MPAPGEPEGDIKLISTGPSVSLQLHQEFAGFRSTMLTDIKSLLQAALQEVLDQHEVLIRNQETSIREVLADTVTQVKEQLASAPARAAEPTDAAYMEAMQWEDELAAYPAGAEEWQQQQWQLQQGATAAAPETYPEEAPKKSVLSTDAVRGSIVEYKGVDPVKSKAPPGAKKINLANAAASAHQFSLFGHKHRLLQDSREIDQDVYDVSTYYSKEGFIQWLVRKPAFNRVTLAVIFANVVWMGIYAEHNQQVTVNDAGGGFQFVETAFCLFFMFEILVRLGAFAVTYDCLKDAWFKFDFVLVVLLILETFVAPIFVSISGADTKDMRSGGMRVVRLLRLVRVTRLVRAVPELLTMVKGMVTAFRAVLTALLILALLVYVFAIAIHAFMQDNEHLSKYWSSLPEAMCTLLLHGVFVDNLGEVFRGLTEENEVVPAAIFLVFMLLSATIVINMLIGVLVEVTRQVATAETELAARDHVRNMLLNRLRALDPDGSGLISKEKLLVFLADPVAIQTLRTLEVDLLYFREMQDMLYETPDTVLTISQIMYLILELRGDRQTTMQDMLHGQAFTRWSFTKQVEKQTELLKYHIELMMGGGVQQWPPSTRRRAVPMNQSPSTGIFDKLASWGGNKGN